MGALPQALEIIFEMQRKGVMKFLGVWELTFIVFGGFFLWVLPFYFGGHNFLNDFYDF